MYHGWCSGAGLYQLMRAGILQARCSIRPLLNIKSYKHQWHKWYFKKIMHIQHCHFLIILLSFAIFMLWRIFPSIVSECRNTELWDFPGGSVVRLRASTAASWVWSLVWELRFASLMVEPGKKTHHHHHQTKTLSDVYVSPHFYVILGQNVGNLG